MDFKEVLQKRRSVREYQDMPIEPTLVQSLIDAAILAPSAVNTQPWEFWVVLGRQRIDDLSDRAKTWLVEKIAHDPTAGAVHQRQHLAAPDLSLLYHAPALVLVATKSFEKQADEDCCLAALSLMLNCSGFGGRDLLDRLDAAVVQSACDEARTGNSGDRQCGRSPRAGISETVA